MTHYNLVHKFIPMPQAMKIPDAKAAVDKEWKKLETISAWQLGRVKSKEDAKKKVHFATLMDICHLKNGGVGNQNYRSGRVVLRGEIVKDDSGAYAVFTEQGSSASQMTAAKSNGLLLQDCHVVIDEQPMQDLLILRSNWRMLPDCSKFPKSECQDMWIRLPRHKCPQIMSNT